jgi:elongation factor 3
MDKGDVVRTAATSAVKAVIKLFPPESTRLIFRNLEETLDKAKWKGKVGILDAFKSFVPTAKTQVANQLGETLPKVEAAMHDTKSEVCSSMSFHSGF